jgi:hypothetical protein
MKKELRYFNFPIQLLCGFMVDSKKSLDDIYYYSAYEHSLKMINDTEIERIIVSAEWFGIKSYDYRHVLKNGKTLYDSIPSKSPKAGINLTIWWDFYKNDKTEFDKICLLAFLSIKSYIQNKACDKIDNKKLLLRMGGKVKLSEYETVSDSVKKYNNEYQVKKIKTELELNWGLISFGGNKYIRMRGFYISYKMKLTDLMCVAIEKSKASKIKKLKETKEHAYENALIKIKNNTANARP